MFDAVDLYCERVGDGLLAEPLNALTNAAFVLAAWLAWREARRRGIGDGALRAMVWLTFAIALGSTAFHVAADRFAQWLDVLPIMAFELVFLWAYLRGVATWRRSYALAAMGLFLAAVLLSMPLANALNGSVFYLPALVVLVLLAGDHVRARRSRSGSLAVAVLLLAVALVFRTVDRDACDHLATGTHFLWHLAVAAVLYLVMTVYMANLPAGRQTN